MKESRAILELARYSLEHHVQRSMMKQENASAMTECCIPATMEAYGNVSLKKVRLIHGPHPSNP